MLDLRSLAPLDDEAIVATLKKHDVPLPYMPSQEDCVLPETAGIRLAALN